MNQRRKSFDNKYDILDPKESNIKKRSNSEINLDDNGHIKSISFKSDKYLEETSLKDMNEWSVPKFALVTGRNGTGKSHLLEYINKYMKLNDLAENFYFKHESQINLPLGSLLNTNTRSGYTPFGLNRLSEVFEEVFNSYLLNHDSKIFIQLNEILIKPNEIISVEKFFKQLEKDNLSKNDRNSRICDFAQKFMNERETDDCKNNQFKKVLKLYSLNKQRKESFLNRENPFSVTFYQIPHFRDFYLKKNKDKTDTDFLDNLCNTEVLKDYFESEFKLNNEIETDFEKIGFKISENPDADTPLIISKKNSNGFEKITSLSTGEIFILNTLSLKYDCKELSLNKPKIILFDEPDKNFDPDYLRLFFKILYEDLCIKSDIQIIMTTHRSDTIKLASTFNDPNLKIFSMKKKGEPSRIQIEECKPLIARFRLTLDRELYSIKIKVYVEAFNDVKFYRYYYSLLYHLCEKMKIKNKKSTLENNRLLSRRYQLEFFSVDKKEDNNKSSDGGGCAQVIRSVQRDVNYYDKIESGSEMINSKIYKPFGIIDQDDRTDTPKIIKENPSLEKRIVFLKRYAIENFIFDPLCFFFNISEEDFNTIKDLKKSNFKDICLLNFKNINLDEISSYDAYFEAIIDNILKTKNPKYQKKILECLNKKKDCEFNLEETKKDDKFFLQKIDEILKHEYLNGSDVNENNRVKILLNIREPIKYILKRENADFEIKEYELPYIILHLKGHIIEDSITKLLDIKKENIYESFFIDYNFNKIKFIPWDLAETFFTLDDWARKQANEIYKPVNELSNQMASTF